MSDGKDIRKLIENIKKVQHLNEGLPELGDKIGVGDVFRSKEEKEKRDRLDPMLQEMEACGFKKVERSYIRNIQYRIEGQVGLNWYEDELNGTPIESIHINRGEQLSQEYHSKLYDTRRLATKYEYELVSDNTMGGKWHQENGDRLFGVPTIDGNHAIIEEYFKITRQDNKPYFRDKHKDFFRVELDLFENKTIFKGFDPGFYELYPEEWEGFEPINVNAKRGDLLCYSCSLVLNIRK